MSEKSLNEVISRIFAIVRERFGNPNFRTPIPYELIKKFEQQGISLPEEIWDELKEIEKEHELIVGDMKDKIAIELRFRIPDWAHGIIIYRDVDGRIHVKPVKRSQFNNGYYIVKKHWKDIDIGVDDIFLLPYVGKMYIRGIGWVYFRRVKEKEKYAVVTISF